ncbi:hypothetical protein HS088_TW22G00753 [Tripterygium wilfordii]|uniref:Phytocyanin domain-containing protein n=1 Tax=Tripterygium wilfordii TaxID=458696 RepID=A0A7J7BZX4_TRIWF|nr:hypothetical protein HS088_TW22G00753 [Tripterygium wilfordii]
MATTILVFMVSLMTICGISYGVVYKVGDSDGWTSTPTIDYKDWASTKTFYVGDVIVFEYKKEDDNVVEVRHHEYRTCNTTSAVVTYSSGKDSITFKMPGHYYYTSGFPGRCQVGQKVNFRVLAGQSPNTPSPPLSGLQPSPSSCPCSKSDASSSVYYSSFGPWALYVLGLWVCIFGYQNNFFS